MMLGRVDLELLESSLAGPDGGAWVDPVSGGIYPDLDGEVLGEDDEPVVYPEGEGWLWVQDTDGHAAFADMEDFADAVADPAVARLLGDALGGRGSFRRFRDAVHHTPHQLGPVWSRFASLRLQARLARELARCDPVGDGALEELLAALLVEEDRVLAAVRAPSDGPRLVLLNGLPGVGKSSLARAYAATRPGVLALDPDDLRGMLGGDPAQHAGAARVLALAMIEAHLRTGHDVVLAQLVARRDQVERFASAASRGGGALVQVLLLDDSAAASDRAVARSGPDLAAYQDGLRVARTDPSVHELRVSDRDEATLGALVGLLAR